tara:strand:- start:2765 stop:3487 length:723 start_codon:yes stop_codon:yes gene_type:complete
MSNPSAAMLVIGDEILSGRTRDSNMHYLAGELTKIGIDLKEARFIADDHVTIMETVKSLSAIHDQVFTSGGIGPTHDDITAEAVAAAFETSISIRADARAILQAHYDRQGVELNEARLRMARIPKEANLIDNPISAAPGFSLKNVHVMAGVPSICQAMIASVLPSLTGGAPLLSQTLRLERGEGDIAEPLSKLANLFSDVLIGSYPFQKDGNYGANIVLRSTDEHRISQAKQQLKKLLDL